MQGKRNKGFTLVELLVTSSILIMIMVPIYTIFYMGYSQYIIQNDSVISQKKARELMVAISDDFRRFNNVATSVKDEGKTLFIKDDLVYTYYASEKKLYKNGVTVFDDSENIEVLEFSVSDKIQDVSPTPYNYDTGLIVINMRLKAGKGEEVSLNNTLRRKV